MQRRHEAALAGCVLLFPTVLSAAPPAAPAAAAGIEWTVPSPAPYHTFEKAPEVH